MFGGDNDGSWAFFFYGLQRKIESAEMKEKKMKIKVRDVRDNEKKMNRKFRDKGKYDGWIKSAG